MPVTPEAAAPSAATWLQPYTVEHGIPAGKGSLTVLDFAAPGAAPPAWGPEAQAAEQRELQARAAALRAAEQAKYRAVDVPLVTLNDGTRLPAVGLGTWKAAKGEVQSAVHLALQAGYRHIDCASVYQNEEEVGEALGHALSRGLVSRQDLYICSKVWNTDHGRDRVRAACERSLAALKLSYLDLYLIHWPVAGNRGPEVVPALRETWEAMEGLVRAGLVRSIGVSNFSARKLADILSYATVKPAVCQVEVHPYHRNDALVAWCKAQGIHVTAFSPLGSPDSASIFPRALPLNLLEEPTVLGIAAKAGRNAGQVLIRWALQHGTSVIPKSTSAARIRGNLEVLDWELGAEDYAALCALPVQQRMVNGAMWLSPQGPYRTMGELWDEPEGGAQQPLPGPPAAASSAPASTAVERGSSLPPQQTVALANGERMPLLGLGTWRSGPGAVRAAVEAALRLGYRHIDCAEVYQNEGEVGEALSAALAAGTLRRQDLWVTSKLWNTNHSAAAVERAVRRTLGALRLEYLDLYLIHWPVAGNRGPEVVPALRETWEAMEWLVRAGLVRSIGVSNFSARKLADILSYATVKPAVCQVEVHPYHRNDALIAWCKAQGIHVTAFSPLGSPDSGAGRDAPVLLADPTVALVAARVGRAPAQVLIRWALQRGTSVLPKSTNPGRIQANGEVWDWELSEADMAALSGLATQQRMVDGNYFLCPDGPYKTLQDLWDE